MFIFIDHYYICRTHIILDQWQDVCNQNSNTSRFLQYYEQGNYSFPQKEKMGPVRRLIIKFFKKKLLLLIPLYISSKNDLLDAVVVWRNDSCLSNSQILLGADMPWLWVFTCSMATSFLSWLSCLVGKRSLSMTLTATSRPVILCFPGGRKERGFYRTWCMLRKLVSFSSVSITHTSINHSKLPRPQHFISKDLVDCTNVL